LGDLSLFVFFRVGLLGNHWQYCRFRVASLGIKKNKCPLGLIVGLCQGLECVGRCVHKLYATMLVGYTI